MTNTVHCPEGFRVKNQGHVVHLVGSDPVLAGDGSTGLDAQPHYFRRGMPYTIDQIRVGLIERDVGMKVPVTGMEHIADRDGVAFPDLTNLLQHVRELGTWDDCVLHHES